MNTMTRLVILVILSVNGILLVYIAIESGLETVWNLMNPDPRSTIRSCIQWIALMRPRNNGNGRNEKHTGFACSIKFLRVLMARRSKRF